MSSWPRQGRPVKRTGKRFAALLFIAVAVVATGVLSAAPSAMAARVSVAAPTLTIAPTADEQNVISVSSDGTTIRVEDTAVQLQTDGSCTLDGTAALCPAAGVTRLTANLGVGDDELTVTAPLRSLVSGRQGADLIRVRNGVADSLIDCGEGTDPTAAIDPADAPFVRNCEDVDDGVAPETAIDSAPPPVFNPSGASYEVRFSSNESPVTFNCRLDSNIIGTCASPFAIPFLDDGQHTFGVAAADRFGNADPSEATATFVIDTIAPDTLITSGPSDITETRTPTFEFASNESGVTFACQINDGPFISCPSPFTLPALENGEYVLRVLATDAAGNVDQTGISRRFIVASPTPVPPRVDPPVVIVLGSIVLISGRTVKMSKSGKVPVSLNCAGSRVCKGTMTLTTADPVRITARKIARLGRAKFNIKPQRKKLIRVKLGKTARKLVKRLRRVRTRATIREVDLRGNPRISSRVFTLRR